MNGPAEFDYRLPMRAAGVRPGSHRGASFGFGQEFAMHGRLFDYPDPRRLDLRASVRAARDEWLVRVHLQRVAVPAYALVDVSASMLFGTPQTKLQVAADFVEALGYSAFRTGDPVGLSGFDTRDHDELFMPARYGRGIGNALASMLRDRADGEVAERGGVEGLQRSAAKLAGRQALVFIVSDFHWPLAGLSAVLDVLAHACVVPMIVWDAAEIEPPNGGPLLAVRDTESRERRTLWLDRRARERWRDAVARRRDEIGRMFGKRGVRPFYVEHGFDPQALSRYFLEAVV